MIRTLTQIERDEQTALANGCRWREPDYLTAGEILRMPYPWSREIHIRADNPADQKKADRLARAVMGLSLQEVLTMTKTEKCKGKGKGKGR